MTDKRGFASDNQAGVHEEVLQAIQDANHGHVPSYGGDHYTAATKERFREHFGDDVEVYFVFNGTAANVLAASAVCRPYDAVISCRTSHFTIDECGATERFTGCRVLTVEARGGKMEVGVIEPFLQGAGDAHRSQARMISITQASELGTVYSPAEIQVLADYAHDHDMYLHMDGSRLANAAAGLDMDLRQVTADVGVDLLSFGGTKNGLLLGEAVVFFDPELPLHDLDEAIAETEKWVVARALAESGGNVSAATRLLGTNRNRMYRILGQKRDEADEGDAG